MKRKLSESAGRRGGNQPARRCSRKKRRQFWKNLNAMRADKNERNPGVKYYWRKGNCRGNNTVVNIPLATLNWSQLTRPNLSFRCLGKAKCCKRERGSFDFTFIPHVVSRFIKLWEWSHLVKFYDY